MDVIDAQLHEPAVSLDWEEADDATRSDVLLELQLAFMRAVGVDRAVLFPVDLAWGRRAATTFPDTFAVVPMVTAGGQFGGIDAFAPNVEELVVEQARTPGVVGIRIVRTTPSPDGGHVLQPAETFDRAAAACAREGLPIFMSTVGDLATPATLAGRHPDIWVIVDHLGLPQPPSYRRESPPFRSLPQLLALAEQPNVAVKVSGVPTLSKKPFPFADLWPYLHQIVDAFGAERLMWGSDISRVLGRAGFRFRIPSGEVPYEGKHTYAEALLFLRETRALSPSDKEWILGRAAQRILRWTA